MKKTQKKIHFSLDPQPPPPDTPRIRIRIRIKVFARIRIRIRIRKKKMRIRNPELLSYAVKVLYRGRISRCPTTSTLSTPPSWRDTTTGNNQPDPGGPAYLALVWIFESYF